MEVVTAPPKIHGAMVAVMREIGAIGKDQRNKQQGFNFRGVDDVYNKLHEIMAKHGIFCLPEVLSDRTEERKTSKGNALIYRILKIKYTFVAEDGSSVEAIVIGEGMDSGDKASNKAMSIAHKYALLQVFMIPTAEEKDPDAERPEMADGSDGLAPQDRPDYTLDLSKEEQADWVNKQLERAQIPFSKWDEIGALINGKAMESKVKPLLGHLFGFMKNAPEDRREPLVDDWLKKVREKQS